MRIALLRKRIPKPRPLRLVVLALVAAMLPASTRAQDKNPAVAGLPLAADWVQHLRRDILPFWETPAALGDPLRNFPTFRCNDGSLTDPRAPCPEFLAAPDWIHSAVGRQYTRMISRQIYLYGVAFHLTGDPKYLLWARAGVTYILDHAVNKTTGDVVSYWADGKPTIDPDDQTSQDLAYSLVGLSFYFYLTRDPDLLPPMLRIESYIRQHYFDPKLGLYRQALKGWEADRIELVSQLDQANAYMLLLTPLLPQTEQKRWRAELTQIAQIIRTRFYDPGSSMFVGLLDPKAKSGDCVFARDDTDFGHTIKTYWMLYFVGRVVNDPGLVSFARDKAPGILTHAFLPATGSWATQPTCKPAPDDIDRTSTWWMSAELDQAALTFGIGDRNLLSYIPKTNDFWLKHMVDPRYGEVWDEVTLPDFTPRLPKVHLWKNGFHTAERALIGYIATSASRSEPAALYYAFQGCKLPADVRPYYYDGRVTSHAETPLPDLPGHCVA
ncbi:MAG TPA: AGE family epimerase/isomerase, partial [Stellaceae bacterium]|nr:AGE family epimerase/isomerase [Stellaceae bacterium]